MSDMAKNFTDKVDAPLQNATPLSGTQSLSGILIIILIIAHQRICTSIGT